MAAGVCGRSFETPRKRAAAQDDGAFLVLAHYMNITSATFPKLVCT
jgi:hypothetical protein